MTQITATSLATEYAAGRLSAPMCLLVETQASMRGDVAAAIAEGEVLGGALLESAAPALMADNAEAIALAAIEALETGAGEAAGLGSAAVDPVRAASSGSKWLEEILALPDPLRERVLESGLDWRFAAPGVRRIALMKDGGAEAELLRIEPGHGAPRHTHAGREFTLVLTGAFHDGIKRYAAGDLAAVDSETTHRPIAEAGEICYALAVTDGALEFKGLPGLVQKWLG